MSEALFLSELEKVRPVLEEERKTLRQLALLDAQKAEIQETRSQPSEYQAVGADLLWFGWESRTRQELNMALARVRAKKLAALDQLRDAFGRKTALAELAQRREQQVRRRDQDAQFEELARFALTNIWSEK